MIALPQVDQLALKGLRVLEIGEGAGLAYAGKVFADFGAEVIKVESANGDAWRSMPPVISVRTPGNRPESALFGWMNTNKRSVVADVAQTQDQTWLGELARSCDIILDARALTLGVDVLAHRVWSDNLNDAAEHCPIEVDITWFGDSGPYVDYIGTDAVCRAMAGAVHGSGPEDGPPHMPHDVQTGIAVGLASFSVALAAWLGRQDGSRRYVLSVHEIMFSMVEMEAAMVQDKRHSPRRGVNRFGITHPAGIYQTSDGWIGTFTNTLAQWTGLCKAIDRPDLANDRRFATGADRMQHADLIDSLLTDAFIKRSTQAAVTALTAEKFPAVIVPTMEQLLQQSIHRERHAFVPIEVGGVGLEGPVLPQRLGAAGPLLGGSAPELGADTSYYKNAGLLRAARSKYMPSAPTEKLPLEGLRIVDLSMGWAGPFASRKLADLGAEVIKIESPSYPDWWRGTNYTEEFYRDKVYEKNNNFNLMNRNKSGLAIDLTKPEGKQLFIDLIKRSDALIENYSAEVLPKLGLDYEVIRRANPDLLMLSMPAFGLGNAWSNTRAYGGTLEQASGLPLYTGHPDGPPAMTSYAYGDPNGGLNATAAMLLGFLVQRTTGKGLHINMSQVEGMLTLTAPFMLEQSLTGRVSARQGNRHAVRSPHGVYPCLVNDTWLVLSITGDSEWRSLCRLMNKEHWLTDPTLVSSAGRLAKQPLLDQEIAHWCRQQRVEVAVAALQQAGIAAGPVQTLTQVLEDPHLNQRGFWQKLPRAYIGHYISSSTYFRLNGEPMPIKCPAPTLGQHTNDVLAQLLGLSSDECAKLEAAGVIGNEAHPKC